MKAKRYTEEQIIAVLKEGETGAKVTDLCRKYGMSDATYYNWKSKYAGLTVSELKRLKTLEEENGRLKQAVTHARESLGLSERKACLLVNMSVSAYGYRPKADNDDALRRRLRKLAEQRKRFGSPLLHILLKREGLVINHKRTEIIYR